MSISFCENNVVGFINKYKTEDLHFFLFIYKIYYFINKKKEVQQYEKKHMSNLIKCSRSSLNILKFSIYRKHSVRAM